MLGGCAGGEADQGALQAQTRGAGLKLPGEGVWGRGDTRPRCVGALPPLCIHTLTSQPLTPCHGHLGSLHF